MSLVLSVASYNSEGYVYVNRSVGVTRVRSAKAGKGMRRR